MKTRKAIVAAFGATALAATAGGMAVAQLSPTAGGGGGGGGGGTGGNGAPSTNVGAQACGQRGAEQRPDGRGRGRKSNDRRERSHALEA